MLMWLLCPLKFPTYCGSCPVQTPLRVMYAVFPGLYGLKTWHCPGRALGDITPLNTQSWKSAARTTEIIRIAQP